MLNVTHYQRNANQNLNEVANGHHQKVHRVWRKGNPVTLLVGMQTGTATTENGVEMPLKSGNRTAI